MNPGEVEGRGRMNRVIRIAIMAGILPTVLASASSAALKPVAPLPDQLPPASAPWRTPLIVVENVGQFDARARFQVLGSSGTLWLADDALWLTVLDPNGQRTTDGRRQGVNLRLSFPGANPHPRLEPFDRLETHISYFRGNDPARWRGDVPVWGGVRYADLYPGIDLEWSAAAGIWQPRLIVHPGAEVGAVRLRVDGANSLTLDRDRLRLRTAVGDYALPLLQLMGADGASSPAPTEPASMRGNAITAPFATREQALARSEAGVGDLLYSTFLGGGREDLGQSIALDATGAAYVTGFTLSTDFPTTPGTFQRSCGSCSEFLYDGFVSKLSADGSTLVYSTFLGGEDYDCFYSYAGDSCAIAVDAAGAAVIAGFTESADFPTTPGAYDTTCNSCDGYFRNDVFVTKLNATGTALVYSTFLGGSSNDEAHGIALDASGAAYITGRTGSVGFPVTPGSFQQTNQLGGYDSFVTKLNPSGSRLVYSTFLGGEDDDCHIFGSPYTSCGIAVDKSGAAYVTGSTQSYEFPVTPGAFQTACNSQCFYAGDGYISKLNPTGTDLVYSTFLGGDQEDYGASIELDAGGAAYVIGSTQSFDFPTTPGAFQTGFAGRSDAFITKLSADGRRLGYSTYLGGPHHPDCPNCGDFGYDIAVAGGGAVAVTGYTGSFSFPVTPDAFQKTCGGPPVYCGDVFASSLSPDGTKLLYSTYLGGGSQDQGDGIALDAQGFAYLTGYTSSGSFPVTPGAFQGTFRGYSDAFVTKLDVGVASSRCTVADPHVTKCAR